jgi:hypothetical protein
MRMIVRTTPRWATLGPRLRNSILVLFALFVAHDAIYLAQFGTGAPFAQAMTDGGHDGYWVPASLVVGAAVALTFLGVLGALARLERQAQCIGGAGNGPSYWSELGSTWLRLFPTVGLLFGIQENVEHLFIDGHVAGLDPLFGPGTSLTVPVLAATTLVLTAIGSLVRWRIRVLEARLAGAERQTFQRVSAICQPGHWTTIAAAIAHRRILDRRDAGRAPPSILPRIAVATA